LKSLNGGRAMTNNNAMKTYFTYFLRVDDIENARRALSHLVKKYGEVRRIGMVNSNGKEMLEVRVAKMISKKDINQFGISDSNGEF
jgi:hypothetical protein